MHQWQTFFKLLVSVIFEPKRIYCWATYMLHGLFNRFSTWPPFLERTHGGRKPE